MVEVFEMPTKKFKMETGGTYELKMWKSPTKSQQWRVVGTQTYGNAARFASNMKTAVLQVPQPNVVHFLGKRKRETGDSHDQGRRD